MKASQAEIDELIAIHGKYIDPPIKDTEILDVYAGLRPIVLPRFATNRDTKAMSRESMTVRHGKVVTLLGVNGQPLANKGKRLLRLSNQRWSDIKSSHPQEPWYPSPHSLAIDPVPKLKGVARNCLLLIAYRGDHIESWLIAHGKIN